MIKQQTVELNIWKEYEIEQDEQKKLAIRNKLIEKYYPLVRKIAKSLSEKLGRRLSEDELSSFGVDGLYVAIRKFDTSRGVKFESYASQRIRGAMLDEVRKIDTVPRSVRINNHQFELTKTRLESDMGYRVSDGEVAEAMGISEHTFYKSIKSFKPLAFSSLDTLNDNDDIDDFKQDFNINLIDTKNAIPDTIVKRKEFFNKLVGKNFSHLERKIIYLYYYEGLSMDMIAERIHLSESRVSQMHNNCMPRLKDKIKRNPDYFSNISSFLSSCKDSNSLF